MLGRGPAVVVSMKIKAKFSVKVKIINQNKIWEN